jgi:phytoene dehydrogenase-like protein
MPVATREQTETDYDVIVVGAGPGGSALAALVAKAGLRTLLVDKNRAAGGRMMTVHRDGFSFELFPINCVPATDSLFEKLIQDLGLEDQVQVIYPEMVGRFYFELPGGEIRTMDMTANKQSLGDLRRLLGVRLWDLLKLVRFFRDMLAMGAEQLLDLAGISALDFLRRYHLSKSLFSYLLSVYAEGFFKTPADRISAAAMVRAVQQTTRHGGGRYYRGGVGSVFQAFAGAVERFGGTVLFQTRVERILVEQGQVAGIVADGVTYRAPIVVSNAGIQPTVLKLVGQEHLDPSYVEWVRNLETNLACVGYRWILDKPVLDSPMNVYLTYNSVSTREDFHNMELGVFPDHSYLYLGTTSLYPGLAPAGKQLVYACMSCLGDPALNIAPYLERVRAMVAKIEPRLFQHIEREERFGPATVPLVGRDAVLPGQGGESYGVALSVGQYGDERLNGKSPIGGLFYVGCDAGGFGLGTHQAVDSAVNVSQLVLAYHESPGPS